MAEKFLAKITSRLAKVVKVSGVCVVCVGQREKEEEEIKYNLHSEIFSY